MNKLNEENLNQALKLLCSESRMLNINPTESDLKALMRKYDMLFLGKNFNTINSLELRHSLEKYFDIKLTNEELNELIPTACTSLNMKYSPMRKVDDLSNPVPYCYQIELW